MIDETGNVILAFPKKQEVVFLNFCMGNSINEIDEQDVNVEFSDELMNFIYKMRGQDTSLLQDSEGLEEGNQMLQGLAELAQKAVSRGLGLISAGD